MSNRNTPSVTNQNIVKAMYLGLGVANTDVARTIF